MTIKQIFDEIASESSNNGKINILKKYSDNELLKKVLYLANSKRIKFYIKQIPEYPTPIGEMGLDVALNALNDIIERKVTGHSAIGFLVHLLSSVSIDDAYILERIIEKDCKIGIGTTFMNKVFKDLIEETPYMGAVSFCEKKVRKIFENGKTGFSQIKMDGRYCNAIVRNGEVELESRQGEPTILLGANFITELEKLGDGVYNGELIMTSNISRYESNGIIASLVSIGKKKSEGKDVSKDILKFNQKHMDYQEALNKIRFVMWDCLTIDEYFNKGSKTPYYIRLDKLIEQLTYTIHKFKNIWFVQTLEIFSYDEAISHFKEVLNNGEEGTIIKSFDGQWKDGKPTWQIKMKLEISLDLKIVGFNYGTKGTKNENVVSSLNVETSCGKLKTRPQGLTEEMMLYVTDNQETLLNTIIEIKCSGLSKDNKNNYSVLYPSFKSFRDDKTVANTLEECIEIEKMALGLKNN